MSLVSDYIVNRFMVTLIDCEQLREKKPSYYAYFLCSIRPLSCLTISRRGQRLRILTPGKLTTMSHTDGSIYLRSRIFLQLGKGSAPLSSSARRVSRVRSETINEILTSVKSTRRIQSGSAFYSSKQTQAFPSKHNFMIIILFMFA